MPEVSEYTSLWTGFTGAPGYTKFRFNTIDTQANVDAIGSAIRSFWQTLAPFMRTGWTLAVQPTVKVHDVTTGALLRETQMSSTPANVVGTNSTNAWAGGVGAMVAWQTLVIWRGHKVQGRTFLVPLVGIQDSDGTLSATAINQITTACDTLRGAFPLGMVVWARQFSAPPNSTQVDGVTASISGNIVRDKTGILRSRRD